MTSVKSHTGHPLSASATTIRRKPALTYRSPVQSVAPLHPERPLLTSPGVRVPPPHVVTKPPPSQLPDVSSVSDISERMPHKQTCYHITSTFLPLYHPFGMLALSLPDLDPAAFGLPVPVAVFDDPTPRSSNRVRRPAAKVRDADEPVAPNHTPSIDASPAPEVELKSKPSPSRRRGGGGHRRKRKELEDGDATYPAKRPRNARSLGVTPSIPVTRTPSKDAVSPTASNPNTGGSPPPDAERGDPAEEKRPTRRTRGRGVVARRGSTASEATVTSASPSVSATNAAVPQAALAGEPVETAKEAEMSKEDTKNPT